MKRRAPASGYVFGNKSQYRRDVWGAFKQGTLDIGTADALILPAKEGLEIPVALKAGIAEHRLHIVDHNPAVVAIHKRTYKTAHAYGVDVVRACERVAKKGTPLRIANFDLTGPASEKMTGAAMDIATSRCIDGGGAMVAVTMLRGREVKAIGDLFRHMERKALTLDLLARLEEKKIRGRHLSPFDGHRISLWVGAFMLAGYEVALRRMGVYHSGRQTMLWFVLGVATTAAVEEALRPAHQLKGRGQGEAAFRRWYLSVGRLVKTRPALRVLYPDHVEACIRVGLVGGLISGDEPYARHIVTRVRDRPRLELSR